MVQGRASEPFWGGVQSHTWAAVTPSDSTLGPQPGVRGPRRGALRGGGRPTGPRREGICSLTGLVSMIPGGPAVAGAWGQSRRLPRMTTGASNRDTFSRVSGPGSAGSSLTSLNLDSNSGLAQKLARVFPSDLMDQLFGQASTCLARLKIGSTDRSLAQNRPWVTRSHFRDHHCFVVVVSYHDGGWANPPEGSHSVSDSPGQDMALWVGLEGKPRKGWGVAVPGWTVAEGEAPRKGTRASPAAK